MAGIREIAREYRDEIMNGIAWVAIWKTGKSWNARAFWLNTDTDMIEDEDMQEARDIVAADANAIFINEYYCAHMGDGKLEEIVSAIRFFYEEGWNTLADSTAYRAEEESKHKLTVESIINIYGSKVKEIKAYNEAKRTKVEEFLQVEPVAFALSDEPDVLRIYIDRESAEASLDGTLKENDAKREALPRFTEVRTVSWDEVRSLCIAKRWYTRGSNEQYSALAGYICDLEKVTTEDLVYIASDILEHSNTEYNLEAILWELNRVCNTCFVHE